MPVIPKDQAIERLARVVENIKQEDLRELYMELHPEKSVPTSLSAADIAAFVRTGLTASEIPDLWNFLFRGSRNVWYNEETDDVHYNEELIGAID